MRYKESYEQTIGNCINMLTTILNLLRKKKRIKTFKKNCTLKGDKYLFGKGSYVRLLDGSTKEDIVLGNNISMYGAIVSEHGGKVIIGDNVWIGSNTMLQSVNSIIIRGYCRLSNNIFITDNNNHPTHPLHIRYSSLQEESSDCMLWKHSANAPVEIGENCWIGQYSRIQKGVKIGNNCIVAANSVVTKSVPDNCIVAGNPAKIVKTDIDKLPYPTTDAGFNEWLSKQ